MWNLFSKRTEDDQHAAPSESLPSRQADPLPVPSSIAEVDIVGETAIATLTVEELTHENGIEQLADLLVELEETGARHFVLDIQNVQFMDSGCLGCLVEALNRLASRGGRIALANTAHRVQYLFKLTRLDRVFSICSDVMSAISAVERNAA